MRDGDVRCGELEAERAYLLEIAHRAVSDHPDAAERLVDVGLHLTPLRALAARLVDVVHDDDARSRNGLHVVPPLEGAGAVSLQRLVLRADHAGDGVPDERPQLAEQALDL